MSRHDYIDCSGPDDPHAFQGISLQVRTGALDAPCPVCQGHGQWNARIDLASQRSERTICGTCEGRGWIETGSDPIVEPDVVTSPDGRPRWTSRYSDPGGPR